MISFMAPSILRANDKIKVMKACMQGTRDGLRKRVDPWNNEERYEQCGVRQ